MNQFSEKPILPSSVVIITSWTKKEPDVSVSDVHFFTNSKIWTSPGLMFTYQLCFIDLYCE